MRHPAFAILQLTFCLTAGCGGALAQTGASSGTLQAPPPSRDQPHSHQQTAPAAAPRQPVHQVNPSHPAPVPVVTPHGPAKPHKPATVSGDKPAPTPQPAVPEARGDAAAAAIAPEKLPEPEKPDGTAARLPRFAALRSDDVNMRAGPGTRYRIDWVYKRRDLPVEIEREFDVWRWVRDPEGIQGWVHQATLMGRRNFIIQKADATMRSEASDAAAAVAVLKPGVIGRIRSCEAASDWCNVQSGNYRGYLRRQQFWGLLSGEVIAP